MEIIDLLTMEFNTFIEYVIFNSKKTINLNNIGYIFLDCALGLIKSNDHYLLTHNNLVFNNIKIYLHKKIEPLLSNYECYVSTLFFKSFFEDAKIHTTKYDLCLVHKNVWRKYEKKFYIFNDSL